MSDFARLEGKLAKLRERERAPGEGRRLRGADPDTLLVAIVTEIDETILPRRLTFAFEDGLSVHLAAANRKLQAMLSPVPKGIAAAIGDKTLSDADDPAVAKMGQALRRFLASGDALSVSSQRPKTLFPSDIGVPTSQLRRVWEIDETGSGAAPPDPGEVLGGYLASLGDDVFAWLRIEGEAVTDQGGDAQAATELGETAAVFLDGYFRKFDDAYPEPSLACATFLAPAGNDKAALFFLEIGEHSAIIAAKSKFSLALASRWQSLVAE